MSLIGSLRRFLLRKMVSCGCSTSNRLAAVLAFVSAALTVALFMQVNHRSQDELNRLTKVEDLLTQTTLATPSTTPCAPCQAPASQQVGNRSGNHYHPEKPLFLLYHSGQNHSVGPRTFANLRKILGQLGYEETTDLDANFTLFWTWNQPFWYCNQTIVNMKPHQTLNKFPGLQTITNKLTLSMSDFPFIPKAFRLPGEVSRLREYFRRKPEAKFIFKNNGHRGIRIVSNVSDESLGDSKGVFVQELVTNPLLIKGHKFDIGVYTVITSVNPLRIYVFNEVQIRFCPEPYLPFDSNNTNKFVVSHNYRHLWEIPGLEGSFPQYTRKEALSLQIKEQGFDPDAMWLSLESVIRDLILSKESHLIRSGRPYRQMRNFFELLRFDFLLDERLRPTLLEVNMSPFLNALNHQELQRLHFQVIYGTLKVAGLAETPTRVEGVQRDLVYVFPGRCLADRCRDKCHERRCYLCQECLSEDEVFHLSRAYWEHIHRSGSLHRVFPTPLDRSRVRAASGLIPEGWSEENPPPPGPGGEGSLANRKMRDWFAGMCLRDASWCQ